MSSTPSSPIATVSTAAVRAGRIVSAIPALFLLFDGATKLMMIKPVVEGSAQLGYPPGVVPGLGATVLACLALYLWPRTSVLGAILLTGFLGGAVATHVRVGNPLFTHVLFPTYLGALVWGGLWLRDARVRALFPLPFRTARRQPVLVRRVA